MYLDNVTLSLLSHTCISSFNDFTKAFDNVVRDFQNILEDEYHFVACMLIYVVNIYMPIKDKNLVVCQYFETKDYDKSKRVKMYQQSMCGYHRNRPILTNQICKITGYYHTYILLELRKLVVSRKQSKDITFKLSAKIIILQNKS